MHAKIDINQQVLEYPIMNIRMCFPELSLPEYLDNDSTLPNGIVYVNTAPVPEFNGATHKAIQTLPIYDGTKWVTHYDVILLSDDEQKQAVAAIESDINGQVQRQLDEFAQTKGYDGITTACTYATSKIARLQTEGQHCVDSRDAMWNAVYEIMADIAAGTRVMPSSFADIEGELPVLSWPL